MRPATAALLIAAVALNSCASVQDKQAQEAHIQTADPGQYYDSHQVLLVQGHPQVGGQALSLGQLADYYRQNDCPEALALLNGPHSPSIGQSIGSILIGGLLGVVSGVLGVWSRPGDSGALIPGMAGTALIGFGLSEWAMAYQPRLRESTETFNSHLARRLGLDL